MKSSIYRRRGVLRCSHADAIGRLLAFMVLLVPVATLVACGEAGPARAINTPSVDTSTMAGVWKGSVTGSYGYSVITNILNPDSTMTLEGENPLYCTVTGRWTVSGGQYTAAGRDCDGVTVISVAPVNKTRLTGTWSASSGRSGSFTVAKQ